MHIESWWAARSICEYCLAAPTSVEIRVRGVLDLDHQLFGLQRVGDPVRCPSGSSSGGTVSATSSSQSAFTPAATKAGARSQPSATP